MQNTTDATVVKKTEQTFFHTGTYLTKDKLVCPTPGLGKGGLLLVAKGDADIVAGEVVKFFENRLKATGNLFWLYSSGIYEAVKSEQLCSSLKDFVARNVLLDQCILRNGMLAEKPDNRNPTSLVNKDFMQQMLHASLITEQQERNRWISDEPKPIEYQHVLPCPDGLYNYMTGVLYQNDTRMFYRTQLPITPDGRDPYQEGSLYNKFIEEILPDPAQRDLLHEYIGILIAGDTHWQKFLMKYGVAQAGKGVIDHLITYLVGEKNIASKDANDFKGDYAFEGLERASVCFMHEFTATAGNFRGFVDKIKKVVGEDPVSVNAKYMPIVQMKLPCRFVVSTNNMPFSTEMSDALNRRMLPLLFTVEIPEERRDTSLKARLTGPNEIQVLLSHCIQGLKRLNANGKFTEPLSTTELRINIDTQLNNIKAFARDCLRQGQAQFAIPCAVVHDAYVEYCLDQDKGQIKIANLFGKDLRDVFPNLVATQRRVGGKNIKVYETLSFVPLYVDLQKLLNEFFKKKFGRLLEPAEIQKLMGLTNTEYVEVD